MDPYWASLTLTFAAAGAILKYLVWDFFHKPESMHRSFSTQLAQARAFIHERKFLPPMGEVVEAVISRRAFLPAAPVIQILTEVSIDADVREAEGALAERIGMDQSYQRAVSLCSWVAGSWLIVCLTGVSLFFVFHYAAGTIKSELVSLFVAIIGISAILGSTTFVLFIVARNKFVRLIGMNQY